MIKEKENQIRNDRKLLKEENRENIDIESIKAEKTSDRKKLETVMVKTGGKL